MPLFHHLKELSAILRKKRSNRGSIDFDFPESKVFLDEMGRPVEIKAYEQNVATKIIEDFMLLANETVAKEYCEREIPFLYRTHENPDSDKMEKVLTFIRNQEYVEVTADVTDFSLDFTATIISSGLLEDMDLKDLDEVDEMSDNMKKLEEATD